MEQKQLYGAFTYWLLHYSGEEEKNKAGALQDHLESTGFNQWGLSLEGTGLETYRSLCSKHKVSPSF